MHRPHSLLVLAVSCVSCTSLLPQVMPQVHATEFQPLGEIAFRDRSSSFDAVRVRSPRMNLARRTDGSWAGTVRETAIDVSVDEQAVRGVNFVISREESTPEKIVYTGQYEGRLFRFEFDKKRTIVRASTTSFTLDGYQEREGVAAYGPQRDMVLKGLSVGSAPPWPQFAFALFGAFN